MVERLGNSMGIGYPILFNSVGVISIFLQFAIYQMSSKKRIVSLGIINDIGWLSYFVLQGDFISGTASIIGIMSKCIILLQGKYRWAESKFWNVFFVAFAGGFALLTFKNLVDIFAVVACSLSILAFFMKKENDIRKIALLAYCAFACNSISKHYIVALIADISTLISCISSLFRYKQEQNK